MTSVTFPNGFLWGVATAAYQVEGAAREDGKGESIWDRFTRVPGAILGGDTGDVACDQYHRYRDDVALMAELGAQSYRFSVSWPRILPNGRLTGAGPNPAGVDYYSRLVDSILEKGILPWLTLYHWDLPQALQDDGGWLNRDTAYRFADYAATLHEAIGDRVHHWTTFNEPWVSAFLGHVAGVHAPGQQSAAAGLVATHHLLLAHGLATEAIRAAAPTDQIGITLNHTFPYPKDPSNPDDVAAAESLNGQHNRIFLDPLFRGEYPATLWEDLHSVGIDTALSNVIREGDLTRISAPFDFLGINYYTDDLVTTPGKDTISGIPESPGRSPYPAPDRFGIVPRSLPTTEMGWYIHPQGLTDLLVWLDAEYTRPSGTALYVTENGSAFRDVVSADGSVDDPQRVAYLRDHLQAILDAIAAGADVRGYFGWSLFDNFEWSYGYSRRFGLVRVDYETQKRTVKTSGRLFAQIVRENAIPELDADS